MDMLGGECSRPLHNFVAHTLLFSKNCDESVRMCTLIFGENVEFKILHMCDFLS